MKNVIKRIEIDLYSPTSYEVIKAQQGDNLSRAVEFALYDQGKPYQIADGISVCLEGHRGDGSSFIRKECHVSGNIITTTLDSDILYEHGTVEAKIVMRNEDAILSAIPFKIHVQKNPCDKNKISAEKRTVIDCLIASLEKLKKLFESHNNDTIVHLTESEHERLNHLTNELVLGINEDVPDFLKIGDFYLKEYE